MAEELDANFSLKIIPKMHNKNGDLGVSTTSLLACMAAIKTIIHPLVLNLDRYLVSWMVKLLSLLNPLVPIDV